MWGVVAVGSSIGGRVWTPRGMTGVGLRSALHFGSQLVNCISRQLRVKKASVLNSEKSLKEKRKGGKDGEMK